MNSIHGKGKKNIYIRTYLFYTFHKAKNLNWKSIEMKMDGEGVVIYKKLLKCRRSTIL